MSLPLDIARCAGRFGLGPDDPICPRRQQCLRYLALLELLERPSDTPFPARVSLFTGLCRDGEDFMIKGEA